MGAVVGDESKVITEIRALSVEARGTVNHHIRNAIQHVISGMVLQDEQMMKDALKHITDDLERLGF